MKIFPAIDIKERQVVRLARGDYNNITVYGNNPLEIAQSFERAGAEYLHIVDLDGAKDGTNPNYDIIKEIAEHTNLKIEVGGGIRTEEVIRKYIDVGVMRVILGTIAIEIPAFVTNMVAKYKDKVAVGVDILNGMVATHGWTEISKISCDEIFAKLERDGVKTVICTDISKDGMMQGTNLELYQYLSQTYSMDIIASGGISSIDDIHALAEMQIHGAILGKAIYTNAIDLREAIEVAK